MHSAKKIASDTLYIKHIARRGKLNIFIFCLKSVIFNKHFFLITIWENEIRIRIRIVLKYEFKTSGPCDCAPGPDRYETF